MNHSDYYAERAEVASNGYKLSIENIFSEAFDIFRKGAAEFIVYGIIYHLLLAIPAAGIFLGGPMSAGFLEGAHRINSDQDTEIRDFFKAFDKFLPMFLIHLVLGLIIFAGLVFLIIPGIYFSIVFIFSYFFVYFGDAGTGEALRLSHKTVSGNFGQILLLLLALVGINIVGGLAFFVGLLLTVPFSYCVIYVAFDKIIRIK